MHNPIYHYNEFEDDYEDEEMFYGGQKRFASPNPNRGGEFLNPNRGIRFSNSIRDKGEEYLNPYEIRIPSFDGNLDIDSSLLWIDEVDKLLNVTCIPMKDHVEFVAYKLKGRVAHGGNNCKTSVCTKANHL